MVKMVKKSKVKRVMRRHHKHKKNPNVFSNIFKNFVSNTLLSRKLHEPMPDGFRTTLKIQWTAVEGGAASAQLQFYVKANSPVLPFNITGAGYVIGSTTLAQNCPGTGNDESLALTSKQPTGLSRLYNPSAGSGIYRKVHVLNSKIKVRYSPYLTSDSITVAVAPQSDQESQAYISTGLMEQAPRCRYKIMRAYELNKGDTIVNSLNMPEFFGETPSEYISNPSNGNYINGISSADPGVGRFCYWVIRRATLDSLAISSSGLPYQVEVEYDCLFSDLAQEDLPTS